MPLLRWLFDELIPNLVANLVADVFSPTSMTGWATALICVAWLVVGWHRRQRAAKKLGMASWYFIVPCLAVTVLALAAAMYGLGLRSTGIISQEEAAKIIAPYQQQIDVLKRRQAPQAGPPLRPTLPKATYNERQIREMLNALSEAKDLVDKRFLPLYTPIMNVLINPKYFLTQEGLQKTKEKLQQSKDNLQNQVWQPIDDFVYKQYSAYQPQMRIALALDQEAAKGGLNRAIQDIIDVLNMFPDTPDKWNEKTVGVVQPAFEKAKKQGDLYYQWVIKAQQRILEIQKNLSEKGVTGYEASQ